MRYDDTYKHFKGREYRFVSIALPLQGPNTTKLIKDQIVYIGTARYHEDTHDIALYKLGSILFVDEEIPFVIYKPKDDITAPYYAREVDNFFGYKVGNQGNYIKRFTKLD